MCKDREQWERFQDQLSNLTKDSFLSQVEIREQSTILHQLDDTTVFIGFTPNMYLSSLPVSFDSIKWLCDEREFDKGIVDYLKRRIGE
jgi:hypothetical protein